METSLFILALSKTLPESCLQGLLVFIVLKLLIAVFKNSSPALRFNLYYGAVVLLFAGFLFTLFKHYQEAQTAALNNLVASNFAPANSFVPAKKLQFWQQISFWTSRYAYTITSLYLTGLGFCILRLTVGLINIRWLKKNEGQQNTYWTNHLAQLSRHFNLVKTVSVFLSDKIHMPLTIGFFKPVIIFPIALVNQLSAAQTEAILLHELAHIKRADYLLNILLSIIQSFLFFNPIIWLMSREINLYREQCCDDLVLEQTTDSLAYAQALLQIETFRNAQLSLALAANGKKYTLLNRIKRITTMKTNDSSPQNKLVILLLLLTTICLSVAWNVPAKKAIKNLSLTHFKVIKEALDTSKSQSVVGTAVITEDTKEDQHSAKTIHDKLAFQANNNSGKKIYITGKATVFNTKADTSIKTKNKFKIVLEDSVGNKKEYNSVEELPKDAQQEFLKQNSMWKSLQKFNFNFKFPDSNKFALNNKFYSNPEWEKQAEELHKQGELMQKQGEKIRLQFNSPEFKKQMQELRKQSAAIGEQARKQFDTPEWKKQMEDLRLQGNQLSKQSEEMRKYYQSPEWKKQQKKIQKEIEKSQKNWRKSMDIYLRPALPEKTITPQF